MNSNKEETGEGSDVGEQEIVKAPLSEEFQLRVMELLKDCTSEDECDFIQDQVCKKQQEMCKDKEPTMDDYDAVKQS